MKTISNLCKQLSWERGRVKLSLSWRTPLRIVLVALLVGVVLKHLYECETELMKLELSMSSVKKREHQR